MWKQCKCYEQFGTKKLVSLFVFTMIIIAIIIGGFCYHMYRINSRDTFRFNMNRKSKLIKHPEFNSDYHVFNPSIMNINDVIFVSARVSLDHGYQEIPRVLNPTVLLTYNRNDTIIGILNRSNTPYGLRWQPEVARRSYTMEKTKLLSLPVSRESGGVMDIRLFTDNLSQSIYGIGSVYLDKFGKGIEHRKEVIYLVEFSKDFDVVKEYFIHPNFEDKRQKNWMPFFVQSELYFIHQVHPLIITKLNFETSTTSKVDNVVSDYKLPVNNKLNGNTPLVILRENVGLGLAHTCHPYKHLFFLMSIIPPYRMIGMSDLFCFDEDTIECPTIQFACGMCLRSREELLISFGEEDIDCRIISYKLNNVLNQIKFIE